MDTKGFVALAGQGLVRNMGPGRTATLKLQSAQTGESVMVFEEVGLRSICTVTAMRWHMC
jgi:hypothetical protein